MMTDFSTMTNDQLDEWLATKVMGWTRGWSGYNLSWCYHVDGNEHKPKHVDDWRPCVDLNQAVMCAEKWKKVAEERNIEIVYTWSGYHIQLRVVNKVVGKSKVDEFARALCEAVAMAMEGEK